MPGARFAGTLLKGTRVRGTNGRSAALAVVAWLVTAAPGAAFVAWGASADPHWSERHVLASYCATSGVERAAAHGIGWVSIAIGLTMLALAPAVARRIRGASLRVAPTTVAGVAVAIAASLAVTELLMRHLHDRVALGPSGGVGGRDAAMARVDPRLGWSYVPRRTTWARVADRLVSYAIDVEGNRAASADAASDPARPTLLFTGESIAFGYGLLYEETFPFLVGRDLGIQAVNLAVVGYGNDQAHLRVLDALARYRHPVAVVTVFLPSQIRRNLEAWRPRLALGPGGALGLVPASSAPRIARLLQALPYRGDEPLRVTAAILRATAEAARARGALPLFLVTNYGPACLREDGHEAWIVDELFVRQGLPFVRVDLEPGDRLPGLFERHPSASGAQKIAAAVERAIVGRAQRPKPRSIP